MHSISTLRIEHPDDPRISFFSSLKGHDPRISERNAVLVEGDQQIERLLGTSRALLTLFLEPSVYDRLALSLQKRDLSSVECFTAERSVMEQIVGYRLHQGAFALAKRPEATPVEKLTPPVVAFNGIVDPENIGSIVRNCAAFGVRSLLVDRLSADPLLRRAIRVSMGTALDMDIAYTENLAEALRGLAAKFQIVGVDNCAGAVALEEAGLSRESVFIFGNERNGIEAGVLKECSKIVEIPMAPSLVDSLNVNAASAVVLYRIFRSVL